RLVLRHLEEDDAAFFLELVTDPDWLRFIGDRGFRTVDEARDYLREKLIESYARLGFGLYAVDFRETGETIGICGFVQREALEGDVDLGFAFLPAFRRQGFAHEASVASLRLARETLGLHRVVALVSPENAASLSLLEKLGFHPERTLRLPPATHRQLLLYAWGS